MHVVLCNCVYIHMYIYDTLYIHMYTVHVSHPLNFTGVVLSFWQEALG